MIRSSLALLTGFLALFSASFLPAQGTATMPFPNTPCPGPTSIAIDDVATTPDAEFDLVLETTTASTELVFVELLPDHQNLTVLSVEPGAGLAAYLDAFGTGAGGDPYDFFVAPDSSSVGIVIGFDPPYDSGQFGPELVRITFQAPATPGQYEIIAGLYIDPDQCSTTEVVTVDSTSPLVPFFARGDVNGDGTHNISDPLVLLNFLFLPGGSIDCPDAADLNDDGTLDLGDPVHFLNWMFVGTTPLDTSCLADSTGDTLSPCDRPPCN